MAAAFAYPFERALSLLILYFLFSPCVYAIHFNFQRFAQNEGQILYQGDAVSSDGKVEMNRANYVCRVGWATYFERVRLWDSKSGKVSDFLSHFTFTIDTRGAALYGHGLAFFLAPAGFQIPPNSAGGYLGLYNTTTDADPHTKVVSVEFDSYLNSDWDPRYQHVGINSKSIASLITTPWNASFHSGDTAEAWITYNATSKNLTVTWDYQRTPNLQENSSLSYTIDLTRVLPEWVTIGFSAATGQYSERHILQSWEFRTDFETDDHGPSENKIKIVLGVSIPLGILIIGTIIITLLVLHKRNIQKQTVDTVPLTSINEDLERGAGPRRFSIGDLASATNNFADQRKLGQGGFGCVYRGYLTDLDQTIAVKKIARGSRQGKKEYITEVKIISRLRHRNLVQLIGWCHDQGEFLLVYEFLPNGSLDTHLWSGKKRILNWSLRYKIAQGLASGLLYLHEEWEQCVVHRDIKSSNIMLDSNFNVKLGDFELARLMDHDLGPQTTGIAGTLGYLAPEYISTGKASKESGVYSFGVVTLEIATGKRSIDTNEESKMGLVEWAWDLHGRGMLLSGIDKRLEMDYVESEVTCLMTVGLWCAHPDHRLRPTIRQAIQVLSSDASLPDLPNKMPVPVFQVLAPIVRASAVVYFTRTSPYFSKHTSTYFGQKGGLLVDSRSMKYILLLQPYFNFEVW